MTTPAPTVHVYGRMVSPSGEYYWLHYVAAGDDHAQAATLALRAWSTYRDRVEELRTFEGQGRLWVIGAREITETGP